MLQVRCGYCGERGHNRCTCPARLNGKPAICRCCNRVIVPQSTEVEAATRGLREQLEAAEKAHSLIFEVINGPTDWLFKVGFINKVLSELKKHEANL